jgi:plastocyanin
MRRVFALLLITPLLANCADSVTPVAPPGAALANEELANEESWTEESWLQEQWLLQEESSSLQSMPSSAVMVLGNPDAGTSYPAGHDQSLHGKDRMIPGTVVIPAGGKVSFQVKPGHRLAIYDDGKRPEDINLAIGNASFLLDPTNRLFLQPAPLPTWTITFTRPGRYLVICALRRHFVVANMYGWVIVQ